MALTQTCPGPPPAAGAAAAGAAALGAPPAQADIYTWVDASGTINVSNIAPPDGVNMLRVIHASAPAAPAGNPDNSDAQVRALTERVGQLENQLELAQSQGPPPMPYVVVPPPVVQYITEFAPQVQYVNPAPQGSAGCDPSWTDCGSGSWWSPAYYPAVVLWPQPHFSRPRSFPGGRQVATQLPMHAPPANWRRG